MEHAHKYDIEENNQSHRTALQTQIHISHSPTRVGIYLSVHISPMKYFPHSRGSSFDLL